jgi:predicted Zn-dependent protease
MRAPVAAIVVIVALVSACATNPVTGRREFNLMSEGQEIAIGQESDPQIKKEMGVYNDAELQAYVAQIGTRIAKISERPQLPWHFTIVDQPAINAFAVPGGYVYFTRGILPFLDNEAELAGVMGHEIGHVTARHSAQQYSRSIGGQIGLTALSIFVPAARPFGELGAQALGVLFLKYGRDDELQADSLGARYTATVGWDPAGVPEMLSTLGRLDEAQGDRRGIPNWLSTHPDPLSRVDEVHPIVEKLKAGRSDFALNRDEFLRHIDGIIYGDNPEQGIVRGSTFLHPPLRFGVDFPQGWDVMNSPDQVVAKAPGAEVYMLLEAVQQPNGRTLQEIALNQMRGAGFRSNSGQQTTINGRDAFVGVYQGQLEGLGNVTMRAAHIQHGTSVYLLTGFTSPNTFAQADNAFLTAIRSFRPLSATEAENVRPNRVDLYVVRQGDSWASIAERSGGVIKPATLAVMNHSNPSTPPVPGARIKIVVGG